MRFVAGTRNCLPSSLIEGIGRYRHQVFVERLGWPLKSRGGLEFDQFDRADTVYVAAQDHDGSVIGTARLLPTTRPYLLSTIFPRLLDGIRQPHSAEVWELSRFAASAGRGGSHRTGTAFCNVDGCFSSPLAISLLRRSIECARRYGARTLLAVSVVGVERLLRRAGFDADRAGPSLLVDGRPVVACNIACHAVSSPQQAHVPERQRRRDFAHGNDRAQLQLAA